MRFDTRARRLNFTLPDSGEYFKATRAPNLTFLLGPDMGPLDRGGLIQNKSFYSQPVLLVTVSIKSLV